MHRLALLSSIALAATFAASSVRAVDISAGPMVGHVTDKSARVWMEFPIAGQVTVTVFDADNPGQPPVSALRVDLEGPSPFVCDLPLNNLQPNHTYRLDVKFEKDPVKIPEVAIRTAPLPGLESPFSVAFGSGLSLSPMSPPATTPAAPRPVPPALPIFKAIRDLKPRAFLFLGNTGLLPPRLEEFPTTHRTALRFLSDFHSAIRKEPALQELLRTTPIYSVFNDRDFGTPNADASFVFAQESLVAFQRFWPNPDWGTPENPGCFSTFSFADTDFFLLDTRTFRDPAPAADDASPPHMLGDPQLQWLKKNLAASKAHFKILAAPCTLFGDDPLHPDADSWSRFPAEQKAFLQWLSDAHIDGVLALAGNQPLGQLTHLDPDATNHLRYPLFTLSSTTLSTAPDAPHPPAALPNPRRAGQALPGDSFGTLDFGGEHEHRFLTLRLHDATGKTRIEQTVFAPQLRN